MGDCLLKRMRRTNPAKQKGLRSSVAVVLFIYSAFFQGAMSMSGDSTCRMLGKHGKLNKVFVNDRKWGWSLNSSSLCATSVSFFLSLRKCIRSLCDLSSIHNVIPHELQWLNQLCYFKIKLLTTEHSNLIKYL